MQKRTLGKTGWEISVIGFGAIKLPLISQKECEILLNKAIDEGVNFVDTADCYGDSEEKMSDYNDSVRELEYIISRELHSHTAPQAKAGRLDLEKWRDKNAFCNNDGYLFYKALRTAYTSLDAKEAEIKELVEACGWLSGHLRFGGNHLGASCYYK